ncbi:MAG: hypothetical protein GYA24_16390 [Candidatus Lokiarchaeota archaeon]|nr:hypothetical protein [Candidatus Lokiarchaeota archaeon]
MSPIARGVSTIIMLALEIRNLLKENSATKVRLSELGSRSYIEIEGSMSDDDVADAVKDYFIVQ